MVRKYRCILFSRKERKERKFHAEYLYKQNRNTQRAHAPLVLCRPDGYIRAKQGMSLRNRL